MQTNNNNNVAFALLIAKFALRVAEDSYNVRNINVSSTNCSIEFEIRFEHHDSKRYGERYINYAKQIGLRIDSNCFDAFCMTIEFANY